MDFSIFKNKYKIEGSLVVLNALHIGSGKEKEEHDAPFIENDGRYYIPGSSFRGYLKTKLERYLDEDNDFNFYVGEEKLNLADVKLIFGYTNLTKKDNEENNKENNKEVVERVLKKLGCDIDKQNEFESMAGRIHVSDMVLISEVESVKRDGIAIDRETGATKAGAKFDYDVIPAGAKFKFVIELENIEEYQLDLISLALKDILDENGDLFGGKLSRGIGKCRVEDLKIHYANSTNIKNYIFKKEMSELKIEEFLNIKNLKIKIN
nr:CRISPR-associated RAMP protein Csx7 [Fusobacterium gastrosuis]